MVNGAMVPSTSIRPATKNPLIFILEETSALPKARSSREVPGQTLLPCYHIPAGAGLVDCFPSFRDTSRVTRAVWEAGGSVW